MKQNTKNINEIIVFVLILISSILVVMGHKDIAIIPAIYLIFMYVERVIKINKKHQLN